MNLIKRVINYIDEYFFFLIHDLGFTKISEKYDKEYFEIIFQSNDICIKLENYHRDIYIYTSSVLDTEKVSALFNVLEYQNQNTNNKIIWNYYHEIKDLVECYKMQLKSFSEILKENYPIIKDFYRSDRYQQNNKLLMEFVIKRNPELFKMIDNKS